MGLNKLERYSHGGYLIKVVVMALAGEVTRELSPILSWSNNNYEICGAYYTKSGFIYNVCARKRINRVFYNVRLTHVINNTVLYITCLY
jgi:hypothetical protein